MLQFVFKCWVNETRKASGRINLIKLLPFSETSKLCLDVQTTILLLFVTIVLSKVVLIRDFISGPAHEQIDDLISWNVETRRDEINVRMSLLFPRTLFARA